MTKKTMGTFMAALRKANGLTQQQVAERLNVSNKTISKWECDDGYPEITMLPAIAELYSVTVDELLKGERIIKETIDKTEMDAKAQKQAAYLFNSASSKFSTLSIISIVIGVSALIFSMLFQNSVIGIILVMLLTVTAIIMEVIAFMNYKSVLNNSSNLIDNNTVIQGYKNIRNYSVAIFTLSATIILTTLLLGTGYSYFPLFCLSAIFASIFAFVLYGIIGKNIPSEEVKNQEYISYKAKMRKTIAISAVLTIMLVYGLQIAIQYIECKQPEVFDFKSDVYSYESENCPQTDYDKFKDHLLNNKTLYCAFDDNDDCYLDLVELELKSENAEGEKDDKVYYSITLDECGAETMEFETKEQKDEFIKNNAITINSHDYISQLSYDQKVLSFDDENLKLETTLTQINWYRIFSKDIILLNTLAAGAIIIAYIILGTVLCYRKKKTLIK